VCGLGDFASNDLFQSVDALARGIDSVHEMHICGLDSCAWELVGDSTDVVSGSIAIGVGELQMAQKIFDSAKRAVFV
jgi:hypothetical protein